MSPATTCRRIEGAISVEFLIAFPTVWVFSLCIFQLILLARADLMVRNAADAAARSASVVLPDDPARYRGQPERSVSTHPSEQSSDVVLEAKSNGVSGLTEGFPTEGSREETILAAAAVPLFTLRPSLVSELQRRSLRSSLGPTRLSGGLSIRHGGVEVSFPDSVDGTLEGPEVTVHVTLNYRCQVPLARGIVCRRDSTGNHAWRFDHSSTTLIHDAPYPYKPIGSSS